MAKDFIAISNVAPGAGLLRSFVSAQRQSYNLGKQCQAIAGHLNDGTDWTQLEAFFGVTAGKGQALFNLINGAVGSMEGSFQVADAKTITEQVG